MEVLGIIPARAGSKRLPGKNLIDLDGRPLLAHTCEAALGSGVLQQVYVNTDSAQIADVAQRFGVRAPVLRPPRLAADDTPMDEANRFLLEFLVGRGERYDAVVLLQPTSPLRRPQDIRGALDVYEANAPCRVVSVSPLAPASWVGHVGRDGRFEAFSGSATLYRLNGAVYVYPFDDYLHDRQPPRTLVHPMPAPCGVDIDTADDLRYAELLLQHRAADAFA
jgi:CMP-N-acetylneuraminic acid synthetase